MLHNSLLFQKDLNKFFKIVRLSYFSLIDTVNYDFYALSRFSNYYKRNKYFFYNMRTKRLFRILMNCQF